MPPTVVASNVIGDFQEDVKQYGVPSWGHRVNGTDQMMMGVPRAVKAQVSTGGTNVSTAQRIMKANGIKMPPKRTNQGTMATAPAAAAAASRPLQPKLADVIEDRPMPGCCFSLLFGVGSHGGGATGRSAVGSAAASGTVPIPSGGGSGGGRSVSDSGHLAAPGNRALTASSSGRGAPSVTTSSFRQANQSIKRVPQSARSRGTSASSRAQSAATARSDASTLSNWDEASDGEFEELKDFTNDDMGSMKVDRSGANLRDDSQPQAIAGPTRGPSRTTSSAAAAYAAGNKTVPKSILKSSKRAGSAATSVSSVAASVSGFNPNPAEFHNMTYSSAAQPIPTYGPAAPPGFTSTSRVNLAAPPPAPPPQLSTTAVPAVVPDKNGGDGSGDAGGGGEWLLSSASGAVNVGGYAGGSSTAAILRAGASSLKLTAEELLGLLMAQGKLTEHDVHELGLTAGAEPRGSLGAGGGSHGNGGPEAPSQVSGVGLAQGLLDDGSGAAGGEGSETGMAAAMMFMRGSDTGNAVQQRVRFGAPQGVRISSANAAETAPPREAPPQQILSSASHRVRFGGDEPTTEPGRPAGGAALILSSASIAAGTSGGDASGSSAGPVDVLKGALAEAEAEAVSRPVGKSGFNGQQRQQLLQFQLPANHNSAILESFNDREQDGDEDEFPPPPLPPMQSPWPSKQPGAVGTVTRMSGTAVTGVVGLGDSGDSGGGRGGGCSAKRSSSDLDSSLDLDEVLSSTARHLGDSQAGQQTETCSRGSSAVAAIVVESNRRGSLLTLPSPPATTTSVLTPAASAGGGLVRLAMATAAAGANLSLAPLRRPEVEALRLSSPSELPFMRVSGSGCGSYRSSDSGIGRMHVVTATPRHGSRHSCNGDPGSLLSAAAAAIAAVTPASPAGGRGAQAFRPAISNGLASRPGSAGSTTSVTAFGNWTPPAHNSTLSTPPMPAGSEPLDITSAQCSSTSISESGLAPLGGPMGGGGGGRGGGGSAAATIGVGGGGGSSSTGRAGGAVWASGSAGPPHTLPSKGPVGQVATEAAWPISRPGMGAVDFLALQKLQSHLRRSGCARVSASNAEERALAQSPAIQTGPARATWCPGVNSDGDRDGSEDSSGGQDVDHETQVARGPSTSSCGGGGGGRSVRFTAPVIFEVDPNAREGDDDNNNNEGDEASGDDETEANGSWRSRIAAAATAVATFSGRHRSRAPTVRGGDRTGAPDAWL